MTKEKAVDALMEEYGADEMFRPFFENVVEQWMGDARDVLASDLEGIRSLLRNIK